MNLITHKTFDEERALYASRDMAVADCAFDGPADGESALKESRNVRVERCFFNLRYPFWHDHGLTVADSELTPLCRAALWYSENVQITGTKLHGVKALRECANVSLDACDIISPEFGWSTHGVRMTNCTAESEYFMMRASDLYLNDVHMKGKYSFQYIENAVFDHCVFDTKDAFWHAKHVTVKNSIVKGEYLAWYSENVTFINCQIIGTQPLCYCKGLELIECRMVDTDLAFERSEVRATLTAPIVSIKNPLAGEIHVPDAGEIIMDIPEAKGRVLIGDSAKPHPEDSICACVCTCRCHGTKEKMSV